MTVYIEYVLIDNFIIDYLLLKATFSTTGIAVKKSRLFLCALFGGIVALLFPLLENFYLLQTLLKILSGLLIVLLAVKSKSIRGYVINTTVFFSYTFITGGAILGVYNLLGINYSTEFSVVTIVIPVYFLLKGFICVVKYLYRRKDIASLKTKVQMVFRGREIVASGFYDTGNGVYDGDSPVIFCEKGAFFRLIGDALLECKLKKIPINTVSGQVENFAVKLDVLKIYNKDEPNIYNNVTLCAVKSVGEGYEVILHPALMENSNEVESVFKIKKIS